MLLPMVIFQGKGLYHGWFDVDNNYVDQTVIFVYSDKGFTTNGFVTQWLVDYFNAWTWDSADGQQQLLILNGYRTHYNIDSVRYAVKNEITLLSYPGHTTYLLQLLYVSLFLPL